MGPQEDLQVAVIARRYYIENKTRVEIAEEMGLSRFKVARILDQAVRSGVVTITIEPGASVDPERSERLRAAYGLKRAFAVTTDVEDVDQLHTDLARVAAGLLTEIVTADDVVGFDSGRTVSGLVEHISAFPPCDVVQLSGLTGTVQLNGIEVLRHINEISGSAAYALFAPLIVDDAEAARVLRQQPSIRKTMERYPAVTKAVVSAGSWNPPESRTFDALSAATRSALIEEGVTAETCALLVDANGLPITSLDERRLGISMAELRAVPEVIGVAGGPAKATAIQVLLEAGWFQSLITDTRTADRLLAVRQAAPRTPTPAASARSHLSHTPSRVGAGRG
jgi:DNA-binding transcriptional regulator LsrR (DeoR family)